MPLYKVNVKWGKNKYDDIQTNTDEPPELLKAQLFALSGVPPDRQKLMIKGKTIQDAAWGDVKVADGATIMMMGSADALPAGPPSQGPGKGQGAAESSEHEDHDSEMPLGLANLGNTCYLNATLQCLRAVPEVRKALKQYKGKFVGWDSETNKAQSLTSALKMLYDEMDNYPEQVIPVVMVESLRRAYPRFAETGERGAYVQQDANEAWTELISNLRSQLPNVMPVERGGAFLSGRHLTAESSGPLSSINNVIEQYMYGELEVTMKCKESDTEPEVRSKEKFLQLSCFISQDVRYLQAGLQNRMKETIVKRAETLGRDAEFDKILKLTRLPAHLTVQLIRFFYKERAAVGAKILKDVKFSMNLDVFDLCSEELQKKLTPQRLQFKAYEEAEMERVVKKAKQGEKHEPNSGGSVKYAPYWFENDVGSNNSGYYELEAVLTHQGRTSNSGHYVAWIRRTPEVWMKFDDDTVTAVSTEEVLKLSGGGDWHCAYILLYGPRRLPLLPPEESEKKVSQMNPDIPMD
ncbi:ubiquitin carboxyl-terminal hydrolase 14-like [Paramacrobiotus metropolitanus]|uniref:ubiquitin carboxyl-terminal hydrolase 14-like n=1 Tax=Paramacrobiotus metropolitanus TaxID=2943436 RepID=UPI0024463B51|nr:ubiquitin carboxyl-terminal hydrolase 14-like [Paramacrobiotus metropolitanus]